MNAIDSFSVRSAAARVVIVMGPSGSGKTTVGREVALQLGWEFVDADDFHSEEALGKMASGVPLDDADRAPWLARLSAEIGRRVETGRDTVLACSALRERHRRVLVSGAPTDVVFVYLRAAHDVLARRLAARKGHFFRPELLASQLAAFEEPREALVVDGSAGVDAVATAVVRSLEAVAPAGKNGAPP